jgi:hypothetical protein
MVLYSRNKSIHKYKHDGNGSNIFTVLENKKQSTSESLQFLHNLTKLWMQGSVVHIPSKLVSSQGNWQSNQ